MKQTGIYKIINPNGAIYIGQSINIKKRWNEYKNLRGCGYNTRLYNSLKKYGFKNHIFKIIKICEQYELNNKEIYYIEYFKSFNTELGLNLHSGGDNHIVSDETIEKLRKSHLGQKPWNKGLTKATDERLKKQGENHSKKMKGRTASEETKLKMSIARKGKKHSLKTKKKLSEAKKGNKIWLGRKHTEESKCKMRGRKLSEETKLKMSISHKKRKSC